MPLLYDIAGFTSWFKQAINRMLQVDRRATLGVIFATALNHIATVIVFVLPLKIVLLIASDGVPEYFSFFVTPKTRSAWLIALATTVFLLYAVSVRLTSTATRNADKGARTLLDNNQQVPLTTDPQDFARRTFHRIGETAAALIFLILALVGGAALFPEFFLSIPALLLLELLILALALQKQHPPFLARFNSFAQNQPQRLIKYLQDTNFLAAFALLLVFYITFDNLNPLLGILAIILSRRIFGSLRTAIQSSLKLAADRRLVDAFLFTESKVEHKTEVERDLLLRRSSHTGRLERIRHLARGALPGGAIRYRCADPELLGLLEIVDDAVWVDSGKPRKVILDLYGASQGSYRDRLFREHLYTPRAARGIQAYDYLLGFLKNESLRTPELVISYEYEGLTGRIDLYQGLCTLDDKKEWLTARMQLLEHFWSFEPPASLITAYNNVYPSLEERTLRADLLGSLHPVADEPWAQSAYGVLESRLERLCRDAADLPRSLFNEDLVPRNVARQSGGSFLLLEWSSWSLQPIGVGFLPDSDGRELIEAAARSAAARLGVDDPSLLRKVFFASILCRIDRLVHDGYPKAALSLTFEVLPLVSADDLSVGDVRSFVSAS